MVVFPINSQVLLLFLHLIVCLLEKKNSLKMSDGRVDHKFFCCRCCSRRSLLHESVLIVAAMLSVAVSFEAGILLVGESIFY